MDKKIIASGLPSFGTKGKRGDSGSDGLSVFFTNLDGEINRQTISQLIKENKSLIGDLNNKNAVRNYISGDTFVDINSNVYEILLLPNNIYKSLGYKYIPNNIFESSNFKNSFGIEKMTNVYLGDKKFLVDDIQSDFFSPNIYDDIAFGNKVGDYTKVNYTDKKSPNNLFLHEAYVSESNTGRIMSIVSRFVNNGNRNYNEFRIGNAKITTNKEGVEVFEPTNITLSIDANKLHLPLETYVTNKDGVSHKIVTKKEYDMGVFKHLKNTEISLGTLGVINAKLEDVIEGNTCKLTISECNFGGLFNEYETIKGDIRANLIISKILDDASIVDINTKNIFNIYDVSNGPQNIVVDNMSNGTWSITLELIDNKTGWSKLSKPYTVLKSTETLDLYVRFVNSYTSNLTYNLSISTEFNVECFNKDYVINALSAYSLEDEEGDNRHIKLTIPVNAPTSKRAKSVPNSTKLLIKCTVKNGPKTYAMQILKEGGIPPTVADLHTEKFVMFNLGYDIDNDLVYDKDKIKFLSSVLVKSQDGGDAVSLVLDKPSNVSYNPASDDTYSNYLGIKQLALNYGNPQEFLHEKDINIKLYNTSPLGLNMPKTAYYLYSDSSSEDVTSELFISRLKEVNLPNDEVIDIFGISKGVFTAKIGIKSQYLYVFVDNLRSVDVNGVNYKYEKNELLSIYKTMGSKSYIIRNPYLVNPSSSDNTYYLTVANREFSSGQVAKPLLSGDTFGRMPNIMIDLSISNEITLNPVFIGFNTNKLYYKKVGMDYIIDESVYNNDEQIFNGKGLYAGGYNVLDMSAGVNQTAVGAPIAFDGLSNSIKFTLQANVPSYSSNFYTCNSDVIYNRFFEAISDKSFRDLVKFNQNIIKPLDFEWGVIENAKYNVRGEWNAYLNKNKDEFVDIVNNNLTQKTTISLEGESKPFDNVVFDKDVIDIDFEMSLYLEDLPNINFEVSYKDKIPPTSILNRWTQVYVEPVMHYEYDVDGVKNIGTIRLVSGKTLADYSSSDEGMDYDTKSNTYVSNLFSLNPTRGAFNPLNKHVGYNNKANINYKGRVNIGNPNKVKSNFKYRIGLEVTNFITYAVSRDVDGDFIGGSFDKPLEFMYNIYTVQTYSNNINLIFNDFNASVGYCGVNTLPSAQAISQRFIDLGATNVPIRISI